MDGCAFQANGSEFRLSFTVSLFLYPSERHSDIVWVIDAFRM